MFQQNRFLYGTVFLTGAAVLVLEIAAVRVLTPYYGSSLYVFSSVLTVILAALSAGYWYGGKRADEKHSIDELYRFISASGLVVLFLLLASKVLLPTGGYLFAVDKGPLIFSIVLFFAPAFLLGIVSPYIIKLQSLETPQTHIGSVVGGTFFWGTVGSILGSIATGFWFIPSIGVSKTIMLVAIVLLGVGLIMPIFLGRTIRFRSILIILGCAFVLGIFIVRMEAELNERYVYRSEGQYSSIAVEDFDFHGYPARILHRDTNNSSAIFLDSKELLFPYTQLVLLYETLVPNAREFLLLGGGAYTMPRTIVEKNPDIHFDIIEIEPILFSLAQTYFDLDNTDRITNITMDARVFLARSDKKYDIIYHNAFGTDASAPFHLTTREYYELAREHLNPGGVLFVNFIGRPKAPRPSYAGSVIKTLTSVFPNTRAFGLNALDHTAMQNVIFVSRFEDDPIDIEGVVYNDRVGNVLDVSKMEIPLSSYNLSKEFILTDDHAPVEYLMAKQR